MTGPVDATDAPTIGVEEEFFVVDPVTRGLASDGLPNFEGLRNQPPIGPGSYGFDHEYQLSILESRTGICRDLDQVRTELQGLRRALADTAADAGLTVVSSGTLPLAEWRTARVTPKPRYAEIAEHYREVVERRATCGCHVHVGIADPELAVQVLNRVHPWLPALLALSVSSPFYEGVDTGYASFRNLLWGAFPVANMPTVHPSHQDYVDTVQLLIDTGSMLDTGHVYWDARLGVRYPTLEFRIADACPTVDEAVLQAGLCRALALTCQREVECGQRLPAVRPELLRSASWRASRSGLDGGLIDVVAAELVPARELLDRLLHYLRPALDELGDWDEISELIDGTLRRGTSAHRQHDVLARSGRMEDVVDALAAETVGAGAP